MSGTYDRAHLASRISHLASRISHLASRISHSSPLKNEYHASAIAFSYKNII